MSVFLFSLLFTSLGELKQSEGLKQLFAYIEKLKLQPDFLVTNRIADLYITRLRVSRRERSRNFYERTSFKATLYRFSTEKQSKLNQFTED